MKAIRRHQRLHEGTAPTTSAASDGAPRQHDADQALAALARLLGVVAARELAASSRTALATAPEENKT